MVRLRVSRGPSHTGSALSGISRLVSCPQGHTNTPIRPSDTKRFRVARGVRRVARGDVPGSRSVMAGSCGRCCGRRRSTARFWRSSRERPRERPGRPRPAGVLPRGGCVCPCQTGLLVAVAALSAATAIARTAPAIFSSRRLEQRGGLPDQPAPPVPPPGPFSGGRSAGTRGAARWAAQSFMSHRRRLNRYERAQAASVRLLTTCASAASATSRGWSVHHTPSPGTRSGSRATRSCRCSAHRATSCSTGGRCPTRTWPRRSRRCRRRARRRRPSGWRSTLWRSLRRGSAAEVRLATWGTRWTPRAGRGRDRRIGLGLSLWASRTAESIRSPARLSSFRKADDEPRPDNCRSSQRGGAAIDSFRSVDRDRGR